MFGKNAVNNAEAPSRVTGNRHYARMAATNNGELYEEKSLVYANQERSDYHMQENQKQQPLPGNRHRFKKPNDQYYDYQESPMAVKQCIEFIPNLLEKNFGRSAGQQSFGNHEESMEDGNHQFNNQGITEERGFNNIEVPQYQPLEFHQETGAHTMVSSLIPARAIRTNPNLGSMQASSMIRSQLPSRIQRLPTIGEQNLERHAGGHLYEQMHQVGIIPVFQGQHGMNESAIRGRPSPMMQSALGSRRLGIHNMQQPLKQVPPPLIPQKDQTITINLTGGSMPILKLVADDGKSYTLMAEPAGHGRAKKGDQLMKKKRTKISKHSDGYSKNRDITDEASFDSEDSDSESDAKRTSKDEDTNPENSQLNNFFNAINKQTTLKSDALMPQSSRSGDDSNKVNDIISKKRASIMGIFPVSMAIVQQSRDAQQKIALKNNDQNTKFNKRATMGNEMGFVSKVNSC